MDKVKASKKQKEDKAPSFLKAQHIRSKRWSGIERDILRAILDEQQLYTVSEVENQIKTYMKKGVK